MKQEWVELEHTTYKAWRSGDYYIELYYQVTYKAGYLFDSSWDDYRYIGKFNTLEQAKEACEKHEAQKD